MIVSVDDPSVAGLTLGVQLKNGEDPQHSHVTTGNTSVDSLHIAADSCCNKDGALHGTYPTTGLAESHTSDLPFTQLILCASIASNASYTVPYGTVSYYSPDVGSCPGNWTGYEPANGRALVPGYDAAGPVPSDTPALTSLEDRVHNHTTYASFSTSQVSYAGIDGCCNNDPTRAATYSIHGAAEDGSSNVPYAQILTCVSKERTFDIELPQGALVFSPLVGCPDGWDLAETVAGRFLVSLPYQGQAGLSFGGSSIPAGATQPQHGHAVSGKVTLPPSDIGLASGCCAGGYAGAGDYAFEGSTTPSSIDFPFLMLPLCERIADRVALRRPAHPRN